MMLPESTREKSVMLAKARGWLFLEGIIWYWGDGIEPYVIGSPKDVSTQVPDLYAPENMALAWRVLGWADEIYNEKANLFNDWEEANTLTRCVLRNLGKPQAQAAWLDKILELAIDAGIVEVDDD